VLAAAFMTVFVGNAGFSKANAEDQIDTVYTFNEICYTKVPNIDAIRDMALKLDWKPLDNEALSAFGNKDELSVLGGWDVQVGEKFYRVGISQGPIADEAKETFPGFDNGVTTSCSMVLDGSDPKAQIATNMQTLAQKQPVSTGVDEGDLTTTTWAGGKDDLKVFLFNKATKIGDGGVLAVTVITKE
jgi:hypothetical protein